MESILLVLGLLGMGCYLWALYLEMKDNYEFKRNKNLKP